MDMAASEGARRPSMMTMVSETSLPSTCSLRVPSEATALYDRQQLCWEPARRSPREPPARNPPNDAPAQDTSQPPRPQQTAPVPTPPTPNVPRREANLLRRKLRNPLRKLPPDDMKMMQRPMNVLEYTKGDAAYRNIQITKDLMKLIILKRQDQAQFDAHVTNPRRPFNLFDRAVMLADIIDFTTGTKDLPKEMSQMLHKQKDLPEFVAYIEYISFDDRRPDSRCFAFSDKTEYNRWTKVFRDLLQLAVQYCQINPYPVTVTRFWIMGSTKHGNMTKEEIGYLMKYSAQLKIKEVELDKLFYVADDNRLGFLTETAFEAMFCMLMKSEVVDRLWKKYTPNADSPLMTVDGFTEMLKKEQSEENVTEEEARVLMFSMYYVTKQHRGLNDGTKVFDKEMFTMFICQSSLNYVGDEKSILHVIQDMKQPLNQYFIHSVNLTSVTEGLLSTLPFYPSAGLAEMVRYCLEIGVRCMCLKVDSPFKRNASFTLVAEGVRKRLTMPDFFTLLRAYAFKFSEFPLWLNFQICSLQEEQTVEFVKVLHRELGDKTAMDIQKDDSPYTLRGKYIVIFSHMRDKTLGSAVIRELQTISSFITIQGAQSVMPSFRRIMTRIQHLADSAVAPPLFTLENERQSRLGDDNGPLSTEMCPIPGVLFDSVGRDLKCVWMNEQNDLSNGPILENLYDNRANFYRLDPIEDRWRSSSSMKTARGLASLVVVRSLVQYETGDPPSIRLPYRNAEARLHQHDADDLSTKLHRIYSRNKYQDDEIPKKFEVVRYPNSMFAHLISHGIQQVEYRPFNPTLDRQIAMAFFRCNRSCGYVLKPWSMRHRDQMKGQHPFHEDFMKPTLDPEDEDMRSVGGLGGPPITETNVPKPVTDPDPHSTAGHTASGFIHEGLPSRRLGDDDDLPSRDQCGGSTLQITVISGANLILMNDSHHSKTDLDAFKEKWIRTPPGPPSTNPYVILCIDGESSDCKRLHTEVVQGNGLAPVWNKRFEIEIRHRECATLSLLVYHDEGTHQPKAVDSFIGGFSVPVPLMKMGYRVIPLSDQWGDRISTCPTLLCHIEELRAGNPITLSSNINRLRKQIVFEQQALELRKKELLKESEALRQVSQQTMKQQHAHDDLQAVLKDMESRYCHCKMASASYCMVC